jgi:hypothetical protein
MVTDSLTAYLSESNAEFERLDKVLSARSLKQEGTWMPASYFVLTVLGWQFDESKVLRVEEESFKEVWLWVHLFLSFQYRLREASKQGTVWGEVVL